MKVVLVYGGKSPEHDISILTASSIQQHINYEEHTVLPVYITKAGEWIGGEELHQPLSEETNFRLIPSDEAHFALKDEDTPSTGVESSPSSFFDNNSIAFPALHGPNGEDGKIQGFFDTINVPYVGCGVLASATGSDKIVSKQLFQQVQIPQVPFVPINRYVWQQERAKTLSRIEGELVYPIFSKPSNMGSSVGISECHDRDELIEGIETAFKYDYRVLLEQGVEAREIEIACLGNEDVETSVPGEVVKEKEFYDYDEKYVNNDVQLSIPADLSGEVIDDLRKYARRAYTVLNCEGLTRCDFFVTYNNDIYLNEVNTMPGFTQYSMYPSLWEATGKPYNQLIEELINLGLERFQTKQQFSLD